MSEARSDNDEHETELPLWEELFPSEYATVAWWVVLGVLLVFVAGGAIPQMLYGYPKEPNQLGDTFGFVNALFAGLGFAGLFITILIQIREFRLAKEERMDAIRIQKEVSDQHTRNVAIQLRISEQQEVSSLIQAIESWDATFTLSTNEVGHIDFDDVDVVLDKYKNKILLRIAREYTSQVKGDDSAGLLNELLLSTGPEMSYGVRLALIAKGIINSGIVSAARNIAGHSQPALVTNDIVACLDTLESNLSALRAFSEGDQHLKAKASRLSRLLDTMVSDFRAGLIQYDAKKSFDYVVDNHKFGMVMNFYRVLLCTVLFHMGCRNLIT